MTKIFIFFTIYLEDLKKKLEISKFQKLRLGNGMDWLGTLSGFMKNSRKKCKF